MTPKTPADALLPVTQAAFLKDLAGRLFRHATPAMGFDQGDVDQLYRIARSLEKTPPGEDQAAEGTFACPICGKDTPHYHSPEEVREHHDLEAWAEESLQKFRELEAKTKAPATPEKAAERGDLEAIEREVSGTAEGLPRDLRRAYVASNGNWHEVAKIALAQPAALSLGDRTAEPKVSREAVADIIAAKVSGPQRMTPHIRSLHRLDQLAAADAILALSNSPADGDGKPGLAGYKLFTDGMQAAAEICGSLAETTYDDSDGFEAATGCEAAIMRVVREQRREQQSASPSAPLGAGGSEG